MKIKIESTEKIVELNGVPARVWEGKTDSEVPVHCFVTRISPQTNDLGLLAAFEKELQETRAPSMDVLSYPLRMVL